MISRHRIFDFLLFILLSSILPSRCNSGIASISCNQIIESERFILSEIYHATNGDFWFNNYNWKEFILTTTNNSIGVGASGDGDCFGIQLNSAGNVVGLHLYRNNLQGTLPTSIQGLMKLQTLYFFENSLHSEFPSLEVFLIPGLVSCLINNNLFEGLFVLPIPLRSFSSLITLDISHNLFNGTISANLGEYRNLSFFGASFNAFTGTIPTEIGFLSQHLNILELSNNRLQFPIPDSIADLKHLHQLHLQDNLFQGPLPKGLLSLSGSIGDIDLSNNQFTGTLPETIAGFWNDTLYSLDLSNNHLQGSLPDSVYQLKWLTYLSLSGNNLEGTLSNELIGQWSNLHVGLDLSDNLFSGTLPPSLGNITALKYVRLDGNNLHGSLPVSLLNLRNLYYLYLSNNRFSGEIPSNILQLGALQVLALNDNQLQGTLPQSISLMSHLKQLYLDHNLLSQDVSSVGFHLFNGLNRTLNVLTLDHNRFYGPTPMFICDWALTKEPIFMFNVSENPSLHLKSDCAQYHTNEGVPVLTHYPTTEATNAYIITTLSPSFMPSAGAVKLNVVEMKHMDSSIVVAYIMACMVGLSMGFVCHFCRKNFYERHSEFHDLNSTTPHLLTAATISKLYITIFRFILASIDFTSRCILVTIVFSSSYLLLDVMGILLIFLFIGNLVFVTNICYLIFIGSRDHSADSSNSQSVPHSSSLSLNIHMQTGRDSSRRTRFSVCSIYAIVIMYMLTQCTHVIYFPWLQTNFTDGSGGYPKYWLMKSCLLVNLLQTTLQFICAIVSYIYLSTSDQSLVIQAVVSALLISLICFIHAIGQLLFFSESLQMHDSYVDISSSSSSSSMHDVHDHHHQGRLELHVNVLENVPTSDIQKAPFNKSPVKDDQSKYDDAGRSSNDKHKRKATRSHIHGESFQHSILVDMDDSSL